MGSFSVASFARLVLNLINFQRSLTHLFQSIFVLSLNSLREDAGALRT